MVPGFLEVAQHQLVMVVNLFLLRVAGAPFAFSCDDVIWIVMELRFMLLCYQILPPDHVLVEVEWDEN